MLVMKFITVCLFSFFILFRYIMICEADQGTDEMDFPHPLLSFLEKATNRINSLWYNWISRKSWNDSNVRTRINEIMENSEYNLDNSVYTDLDSMIIVMASLSMDTQKHIAKVLRETMRHLTEEFRKEKNKNIENELRNKINKCNFLMRNALNYTTVANLKPHLSMSRVESVVIPPQ